jgi:hypothetical protein
VIRAVALATLVAALLAGCADGSGGRQTATSAAVPTTTNDNSWSTFEAYVAAFEVTLSQWQGSVVECLSGTSVKSCLRSVKGKLELAYDAFETSANRWLDRPRLSFACRSWAFDVVTPLVDMYAIFMTSTVNLKFGTSRDISSTLDLGKTLAAKEKRALNKARNVCGAGDSGS